MTFPHHPTIDEIADFQEGLLPAADAATVRAHVEGCDQCQQTLAALEGVSATLAAHAAEPARIPDTVVQRVEEALATAATERVAGVRSLAEQARSDSSRRARRPHGWLLGAAAAAAAVVVLGAVLEIGTSGSSSDDAGSADTAEQDAGGGGLETGSQGGVSGGSSALPESAEELPAGRVNPGQLQVAAQGLASGYTTVTKPTGNCAIVADDLDADLVISQYGAGSELGLMVVDEAAGTYRLVDCDTGALISKGKL
ncbi:MAG: anti-sigma factor family protein [Nocardioidaceae bacterium]